MHKDEIKSYVKNYDDRKFFLEVLWIPFKASKFKTFSLRNGWKK